MSDEQTIDDAYDSVIRQLFSTFWVTMSGTPTPAEIEAAEQRFQTGIERARTARDRAKQLL